MSPANATDPEHWAHYNKSRKDSIVPLSPACCAIADPAEWEKMEVEDDASFNRSGQASERPRLIFPARFVHGGLRQLNPQSTDDVAAFVEADLDTGRLDRISNLLWFAGQTYARPQSLTRHLTLGRSIVVTDQMDMHLVTHMNVVYVKPLPEYLLNFRVWSQHISQSERTRDRAYFMLSCYTNHLLISKSDFRIAHANGLIPDDISWAEWVALARNKRFRDLSGYSRSSYGEFSLARLNWICRLTRLEIYHPQDGRGWAIGVAIYITIVLTMQVGLEVPRLSENFNFQRASYGFTVFSIITPVVLFFGYWTLEILRKLGLLLLSGANSSMHQSGADL